MSYNHPLQAFLCLLHIYLNLIAPINHPIELISFRPDKIGSLLYHLLSIKFCVMIFLPSFLVIYVISSFFEQTKLRLRYNIPRQAAYLGAFLAR